MEEIPETEALEVFKKEKPVKPVIVVKDIDTAEVKVLNTSRIVQDGGEENNDQHHLSPRNNSDIVLPQSVLKSNIPWYIKRATIMSSPRVGVQHRTKRRLAERRGTLLGAYIKFEAEQVGKRHTCVLHADAELRGRKEGGEFKGYYSQ